MSTGPHPTGYRFSGKQTPYEAWVEQEGMPLIGGHAIEDMRTISVGHWERLGVPASFVHFEGCNGYTGAVIADIPPGGQTKPMHHMYEQQIFILNGRGVAQFWTGEKTKPHTVEWQPGSVFSPPLNVTYQLFNGSGSETARFVGVNNAPMIINIFRNADFMYNTPYEFTDRFDGRENYFDTEFRPSTEEDAAVNFIPDANAVKLTSYENRGRGFSRFGIALGGNAMAGHIGEFEVGTYKKAHRHSGGAFVLIIGGQGYSLIWPPGGELIKLPWKDGSVLVPPENWYHHHFNTGPEPARCLALRRGFRGLGPEWYATISERQGGHLMEYEDEPPEIRAMFEAELKKNGVPLNMEPIRR
jgi:quercetin dioxygenase-like cupin family protein